MCSNNANSCRLCKNLIISQSVTFAGGLLVINLPAGNYLKGCKYCIVVAQAIPAETTINAPVVVTVGDGTVQYPLTRCNCAQVTACALRTRTRYPVTVVTDGTSGSFRLRGSVACAPNNALAGLDGTAPEAPAEGGGGA